MPRYSRRSTPGSVQHVISRFLNRDFLLDRAGARDAYLGQAQAAFAKTDWSALAYALMSSHVHWAVQAGDLPSSSFVKPMHVGFASRLNRMQARLGPVFAGRHRTVECVAKTAATLIAYIHNNPVRAAVVADPADSRWTSHRMYLGLDPAPPWLQVERGLELCGFSATPAGRRAFHAFVVTRVDEARCEVLSGRGVQRARSVARAQHRNPVEVGSPLATEAERVRRLQVPVVTPSECAPRLWSSASEVDVIRVAARAAGIPNEMLATRSRARAVSTARRLALLIWCRQLGWPASRMARALGITSSSAAELIGTASLESQELASYLASGLADG